MDLLNSLYLEHLEEIAPIYDSRIRSFSVREWTLSDTMDLDNRLEPHLDALTQDGRSQAACEKQILEGDPGECYGAVRVYARQSRWDHISDLIGQWHVSETDQTQAVTVALCHESVFPVNRKFFEELLEHDTACAMIALEVISFHRLGFEKELLSALSSFAKDKKMVVQVLTALGRLRCGYGADRLLSFALGDDADIMYTAILALSRIGNERLSATCKALVPNSNWPALLLGLLGATDTLSEVLTRPDPCALPDHMTAAGISGDVSFVPYLIDRLNNPDLSESAAAALELITGFGCHETHAVAGGSCDDRDTPERQEEHSILNKSRERTEIRLSRDPDRWADKFRKNHTLFDMKQRYRHGKPSTPSRLFAALKSPETPDYIRQLACDELVIRHGIDIPFDTMMTSTQQRHVLKNHETLVL